MFEITPFHIAIGKGWFTEQQGFCLEFNLLTINIYFRKKEFSGSIFSIYLYLWKDEGKLKREVSGDFIYLNQYLKNK